jgi:uncharacterized protein involved in type VI secretion and phage assembly
MNTDAPRDDATARVDTNAINGVAVAIVRENRDPTGLARVRVSFPWHSQPDELFWARLTTPMAGKGYGTFFLPEVDDQVLVAFEHGDLRFPCVVGSLWSGERKPPATNADGRNDIRTIRTRKGHALRFDDGVRGHVRLELNDGKAITIDDAGITIDAKNGNRIVIGSANGTTTIEATSMLRIRAPQIAIEASGALDISAGGTLTLRGALVAIN